MQTVLTTTTMTPSSFAVRQWRRFSSQVRSMHLKRQKSTSSRKSEASSKSSKSSKSNKSVRFELVEDVYYTHSPSEYDRSPATEHTARPVLGQLFFIDEKDDYDKALVRNTNNNRHRSFQSAVIHLALRAWRWRVLYFFSHSGIIILSWTKKIILVLPHHTPQLVPPFSPFRHPLIDAADIVYDFSCRYLTAIQSSWISRMCPSLSKTRSWDSTSTTSPHFLQDSWQF